MKHISPIFAYYDLKNPTTLDPTFGPYVPRVPVNLGTNVDGSPSFQEVLRCILVNTHTRLKWVSFAIHWHTLMTFFSLFSRHIC